MRTGLVICNSSFQFSGAVTTPGQAWVGGRSGLLIDATSYGTLTLQLQNISQNWLPIASSFVSNQLFIFDALPGQYRLSNSAGSSVAVSAFLGPVPYNL